MTSTPRVPGSGATVARWFVLAGLVWIADRITKLIVDSRLLLGEEVPVLPVFSWIRLHNEGAAFSFLADQGGWQRWLFVALAIGFSAYLVTEIRRLPANDRLLGWAYGLVLGGALGNLWDRAFDGYVVDFVLVHYANHFFPAFNVADSAISIGAALWIVSMLRDARREHAARTAKSGDRP
jgi:signal peptidase II